MRGMGHSDPIETVTFKHEEGNEGEKIGVKRGIAAFYGGKLLKRQGEGERSWNYSVRANPRLSTLVPATEAVALRLTVEAATRADRPSRPHRWSAYQS